MTELHSVNKRMGFAELDHLAERFGVRRTDVVEAAIAGKIELYFKFEGSIAELPNPAPGNKLRLHQYSGYLRASAASLEEIHERRVARYVREAHRPGDGRLVYIELPALSATLAEPLHLELKNLYAIGDDVKRFAQRDATSDHSALTDDKKFVGMPEREVPANVGRFKSLAALQEDATLDALQHLGHDPLALSTATAQRRRTKADVREHLAKHHADLFKDTQNVRFLDHTWSRLREDGRIRDQ